MTAATVAVRHIMAKYNKSPIWGNRYDDYRAIRCLQGISKTEDEEMVAEIVATLDAMGVRHRIRFKYFTAGRPLTDSIVVAIYNPELPPMKFV